MGGSATVRHATVADFDGVAAVLTRSFIDDPVISWFFPNESKRSAHVERFFRARLRQLIGQDLIYTTDDYAGAALWALPGRWKATPREQLALAPVVPAMFPRLVRVLRADHAIETRHPSEPHFYLPILGTDPARQGEGIGSALLAPLLAIADTDGIPCYLESSKEANIAFYGRHGFDLRERVDLPGGGPSLWPMWRDPR